MPAQCGRARRLRELLVTLAPHPPITTAVRTAWHRRAHMATHARRHVRATRAVGGCVPCVPWARTTRQPNPPFLPVLGVSAALRFSAAIVRSSRIVVLNFLDRFRQKSLCRWSGSTCGTASRRVCVRARVCVCCVCVCCVCVWVVVVGVVTDPGQGRPGHQQAKRARYDPYTPSAGAMGVRWRVRVWAANVRVWRQRTSGVKSFCASDGSSIN